MLTLYMLIAWALRLYGYALFARILMSWFPDLGQMVIGRILIAITEPYFAPFRRFIPPLSLGGVYLDIASLIGLISYMFVDRAVLWLVQTVLQMFGVL